ncbi:MAG: DUF2085 domain-containing protein [Ruminococcaceae bacterium]|nr:DUF2085 domain-containing protein [Oscillospiraceae bacterium]
MELWLYRWLPIFFGCHCRPDRSFIFCKRRFPICARCTGELVGMLISSVSCCFFFPPVWAAVLMLLPLAADGFIQLKTRYESTNFRRFITGVLFGYAFLSLLLLSFIATFRFGKSLAA